MEYKILRLILILLHLSSSFLGVKGQLDQICISLGVVGTHQPLYTGDNPSSLNANFCPGLVSGPAPTHDGSIGGKKYQLTRYTQKMMAAPPTCLERGAANETILQVNAVKDKDTSRYLSGWLSFGFNIYQKVYWAFIQVSDEDGNAIGEFVSQGGSILCGEKSFPKDVKYGDPLQYLPCSAGGLQEPRVAQAVVYTAGDSQKSPGVGVSVKDFLESPDDDNTLKMRFLWRLNEYYCNRHEKFRIVVFYLAGEDGNTANPVFMQSDWFYPNWFGVADIIHEATKLECLTPLSSAIGGTGEFWIEKKEQSTNANDNLILEEEESGLKTLYKACRTFITRTTKYRGNAIKQPAFGGRCESKDEKKFKPGFTPVASQKSSVDVPHGCKKNPKAKYPPDMENYKSYLEKREKLWETVCNDKKTTCPQLNASDIKKKTMQRAKKTFAKYATGRYIMRSRAYHGLTLSWAFLFFIPISNFIARYFKETFLDCNVIGLRLWWVLHIGGIFWAIAMIVTALSASTKVSNAFGHSWDPVARRHVNMGWICIALFILTMLLGPFRPLGTKARTFIMVAHSVLGFAHYIIGLYLIILSTVIPGSPSASVCYRNVSVSTQNDSSLGSTAPFKHKMTIMVIVWFGVDIFFHFIMNRLQLVADNHWNIKRPGYFPLLPIVRMEDTKSFKYFRYRTFLLYVYTAILLIILTLIWRHLYDHDWRNCDAGPMTCTHRNNSAEGAYPEIICGRMVKIRALRKEKGLD